jgi:hypothetical protein
MLCFLVFLEYQMMDKVQKPSDSGCYTRLSVLLKMNLKFRHVRQDMQCQVSPSFTIAWCVITLRMEEFNWEYTGSGQRVDPMSGD